MLRNRNANVLLATCATLLLVGAACDPKTDPAPAATPVRAAPTPAAVASPAPSVSEAIRASADAKAEKAAEKSGAADLTTDKDGLSKATVRMETTKGVIEYKFYPKDAPKTSKRIAELVQKGFYNGLTFHRVVPGFVIQGGDPTGNGTGGSGQKIPAEFNSRKHVLGAVAMARSSDPNSADSQFYVALGDLPSLDGQYTVFGKVISGIEVVQKIQVGDKMTKVTLK